MVYLDGRVSLPNLGAKRINAIAYTRHQMAAIKYTSMCDSKGGRLYI